MAIELWSKLGRLALPRARGRDPNSSGSERVIPLTHDTLCVILGVRRAGITTALADLEQAGAIKKARGTIELLDHVKLERKACECYGIIASEYRRLTAAGVYRHKIDPISGASDSEG